MYKVFNRWELNEVEVNDPAMVRYVNLTPVLVPHSMGRHARQVFNKSDLSIVERLINKMMRKENNTGKKMRAYSIVKDAFEIVYTRTKKNPVQVLVEAISNAGPREEIVRLKYGGIAVPKAVDTSAQRRVDQALMFITRGAWSASFKHRRPISEALASEIIACAAYDAKSFAISQKDAKERVAKGAR